MNSDLLFQDYHRIIDMDLDVWKIGASMNCYFLAIHMSRNCILARSSNFWNHYRCSGTTRVISIKWPFRLLICSVTSLVTKMVAPLPYPFSLEEELKKNPEIKMSDVEMLREWCEKQRHLPKVPDLHLIMFLHSNYYSMEAAKNTAESFFTIRSLVPEFFSNRDPRGLKELRQAFNVA